MKSKLENSTTISIKREDLSIEKTVFQILKKEGIKDKVEAYLNWLKTEYSTTTSDIDKIWKEQKSQEKLDGQDDETDHAIWLSFILPFTGDKEITKKILKKVEEEKLENIFLINDKDNDIKKDLKAQPKEGLKKTIKLNEADEIIYTIEICKSFYLEWLPKFIEDILKEKQPTLELKDLDRGEWEKIRNEIFTQLYASWSNTWDLEEIINLQKKLGEGVADLNELVQRTRETVVNDLKTAKENYKTKRPDGQPWTVPLTKAEKDKIDEAANKDDLEKVAGEIVNKQDGLADPKDLTYAKKWIEDNISSKNKGGQTAEWGRYW